MITALLESVRKLECFADLRKSIENKSCAYISGLSNAAKAQLIFALSADSGKRALVITNDEKSAITIKHDLEFLYGDTVPLFPNRDFVYSGIEGVSRDSAHARIAALSSLISCSSSAVIAPITAVMDSTISKEDLIKRTLTLNKGTNYKLEELIKLFINGGYSRVDTVEGIGQFSVRGEIIDIYSPSYESAIRLDFFDTVLESIHFFDTITQRRTDETDSVTVAPCEECIPEDINNLISILEKKSEKSKPIASDLERIKSLGRLASYDAYQHLFIDKPGFITDYCDDMLVFVVEPHNAYEFAKSSVSNFKDELTVLIEDGTVPGGKNNLRMSMTELTDVINKKSSFLIEDLRRQTNEFAYNREFAIQVRTTGAWQGSLAQLDELVNAYLRKNNNIMIFAGSDKNAKYIASYLQDNDINAAYIETPESCDSYRVTVTGGFFSSGLEYDSIKHSIITCGEMPAYTRKKRAKLHKKGSPINTLADIKVGDYLVHSYYGIGMYQGVEQLTFEGITKEYIKIQYAGTDSLFVPVNQLDLVSKYIGGHGTGMAVPLSKMGGSAWKNATKRAKAATKDLAKELIKLYAERVNLPGHAFSPDTEWQREFEAAFPFEETDDQLRCIEEIKSDMERTVPMDRILCGDVGYGKTEVALRAAFKCIADGKQVAILVPTTILALQHYNTAIKRFERMPVEIEFISRFKTKKEQTEILKRMADGRCDMIIGTHRILSKDIQFKDLGLLIVDEEQRFGVASKEKLKQLCKGVDTLMLSATPIPRTLNMALSGIRDMSMLDEPPNDRQPVLTFVAEHSLPLVFGAIERELARGGQVYYLRNRIEGIENVAAIIADRFPEANVAVAHGRMDEDELSSIWASVVSNETQILVCTTIIETGIDVPNVNTLIVENADMMGLSQLHQLRGRVGRSSRRAYAYFTFKRNKQLSEISEKRLTALREFTEFGSGIRIAMRDLEIRGAGNLIGSQQHGHMDAIGYDLYMKMLAQAVSEEKGEEVNEREEDCLINIPVSAYIPDSYVDSELTRIELYRMIAAVKTSEDAENALDELNDRFGTPPESVNNLISIAIIRNEGNLLGLSEITYRNGGLCIMPSEPDENALGRAALIIGKKASVKIGAKPYLYIKGIDKQQTLSIIGDVLDKYKMAHYAPQKQDDSHE